MSGDVFVPAAALRVLLELAAEVESRTLAEVDAMSTLWAALVPEDEAARRAGEGLDEVMLDDNELGNGGSNG